MKPSGARIRRRNLATNPQCLCDIKGAPPSSCSQTASFSRESALAGNTNRRLPMRQPARSSSPPPPPPVISPLRQDDGKELLSLLPPLSTGEWFGTLEIHFPQSCDIYQSCVVHQSRKCRQLCLLLCKKSGAVGIGLQLLLYDNTKHINQSSQVLDPTNVNIPGTAMKCVLTRQKL